MLISKQNRQQSACQYDPQSSHSHLMMQSRVHPYHSLALHARSTQDQYNDIFKAISSNYFEKTAIGEYCRNNCRKYATMSLCKRGSTCSVERATQKQGQKKQNKENVGKDKYQIQQWNQTRQINRLLRIAQNIQAIRGERKQNKPNPQPQPPILSSKPSSASQKRKSQPLQNYFQPMPYKKQLRRYRKQHTQAHKAASNPLVNYKFVRIHKKQQSKDLNKLKQAVAQLESFAITKYGMNGFTNVGRNWEMEDSEEDDKKAEEIKIKDYCEFQQRLKQIRSVECNTPKTKPQDSSIPVNFMRALSAKRVPSYTYSSNKKKQNSTYIRV